jgi:Uma2 family endonuclease
MIIFAPILTDEKQKEVTIPKYDGVKMSLEEFQNWKPEEESGIKYEWNDGTLEATDKLKFSELKMIDRLQNKFYQTDAFKNGDRLLAEVECYFPAINKIRIPDLCYLEKYQIDNCMKSDTSQIPKFVIEIISKNNSGIEIAKKNNDYINSGVRIIWNVYPELEEVMVYYSHKEIFKRQNGDVCDTNGLITGFNISVREIFR